MPLLSVRVENVRCARESGGKNRSSPARRQTTGKPYQPRRHDAGGDTAVTVCREHTRRLPARTVDLPVISAAVEQYRPSADGQRFLFCLPLTSVRREPLMMLLSWPAQIAK